MTQKLQRYERIYEQLAELLKVTANPVSRRATMVAVLHHKMKHFYWTGFYFLHDGKLLVDVYQGSLACQLLKENVGVCWAAINQQKTQVVPNVHEFEGHIACSSLTNSEIVVPLYENGQVAGCLDIDSREFANFDEDDVIGLEKILTLL